MAQSKVENNDMEDFLEEDKPIQGQKYVCLSFISPENVLDDKKTFNLYHFLKEKNPDYAKTYAEFKEDFKYYQEDNVDTLQDKFDELVDYQTNVRGVKVRGVYDNIKAANIRAKVLQKLDRSFHVYVGQVGYWLPWDPSANNIEDQEYAEPELNRLVKEYKKNETKKDMFYEEQKREKQKAAMEESLRLQKQNEELRKQEEENQKLLDEVTVSNQETTESVESIQTPEEEVNNVSIKTTPVEEQTQLSSENSVDPELKESLEAVDPWMERKMEEGN